MTLEEQIKIVMEFCDWKTIGCSMDDNVIYFHIQPDKNRKFPTTTKLSKGTHYHNDWNWLMPVWIKYRRTYIGELSYENQLDYFKYKRQIIDIMTRTDTPQELFNTLADAIQWLNKIKK